MKRIDLHITGFLECTVIRRLNRFVAEIDVNGRREPAWINNTGRLEEFLFEGNKGFCLKNDRPGKTTHRLFALKERGVGAIIDTRFQVQSFEKAMKDHLVSWAASSEIIRREVRLGDSVIDYLLQGPAGPVYLEVKSAVLREGRYATYPDCPTVRGQRHVRELTEHRKNGGKASILFIGAMPEVEAFKPYPQGDQELCDLLKEAYLTGVEVRAIGLYFDPVDGSICLYDDNLEVEL